MLGTIPLPLVPSRQGRGDLKETRGGRPEMFPPGEGKPERSPPGEGRDASANASA